jgi:DNA invertase Pin-like site-specific DNA recombinase
VKKLGTGYLPAEGGAVVWADAGECLGQLAEGAALVVTSAEALLAVAETARRRQGTRDGLDRARNEGRIGGQPAALSDAQKAEVVARRDAGETAVAVAARFGVGKRTVDRTMAEHRSRAST